MRVVRVHVSTGYNRVEGNRRASRNGRVSHLPPEIPNVTIRNFFIAVRCVGAFVVLQACFTVRRRRWKPCRRSWHC
jgi:hypothetical protein